MEYCNLPNLDLRLDFNQDVDAEENLANGADSDPLCSFFAILLI